MCDSTRTSHKIDADSNTAEYQKTSAAKKSTFALIKGRLKWPFFIVIILFVFLCGYLFYISMEYKEDYTITILKQQDYSTAVIPFRRGTITDRNGTVLATSERVYTLILDPSVLNHESCDMDETVKLLNRVFGLDETKLRAVITADDEAVYIPYQKLITEQPRNEFIKLRDAFNNPPDTVDEVTGEKTEVKAPDKKIKGVWFETNYIRRYPLGSFACTVLGFSGTDSARGNWGIEEYYNSELVGVNGKEYGYINSEGLAERSVAAAQDGNTLVSTIDYTIQSACQKAIADFLLERGADNVAAICLDPRNGEILAMATDKSFDLNDPSNLSAYYDELTLAGMTENEKEEARGLMWHNFCIQDAYEPGSTAKPFTVAAALEEGIVSRNSSYVCEGEKTFGSGRYETTIHCNKTHGDLSLKQSIMFSCNSVMMDIAALMGRETLSKYQTIFGFGRQSGIDLPGETAGILYKAENMGVTDLASNSFGQNYNVNMVQLAAAFASCVNGGYYYTPHIVKQILSSDGRVIRNIEPSLVRKTVSSETVEFLKDALFDTVESGTGKTAAVEGYLVGGKTGTAEKHPRSDHKYLVSFISATPIDDPELLIYVIIDNPEINEEDEDGTPSAKLAIGIEKQIMEAIIPYLNITKGESYKTKQEIEKIGTDILQPADMPGSDAGDDEPAPETQDFTDEKIPVGGYVGTGVEFTLKADPDNDNNY